MTCKNLVDSQRRMFLQGGLAGALATVGYANPSAAQSNAQNLARLNYPVNRLANLADLAPNEPVEISYPDADSPGVLIKLGTQVRGGVGPEQDIVGFSVLCPHKGYQLSYNAADRTLNCPGHYSRFDCEAEGQQTWGHATQNLPQFSLRVDEQGDIFAEGVDELIYGRLSNILQASEG